MEPKTEGSTAVSAPTLMTTEQYIQTPESLQPTELIYGVLRVADTPLPRHQQIIAELHVPMALHVKQNRLGRVWLSPLDVFFDWERHLVLQPDMFFIARDRLSFLPDRIRLIPDLVVEVLSPNPRIGKLNERLGWFAEYGVRECWLVRQYEYRTEVLQFEHGKIAARESYGWEVPLQSTVLPDFRPVLYDILDESLYASGQR